MFCEQASQWPENHFPIGEHPSPKDTPGQSGQGFQLCSSGPPEGLASPKTMNLNSDWFT